jgi:pyrimidine-specific ribonucleoside hydrolase
LEKIPVIMDVDTGIDDAMAIILALSQRDGIDLLGITTVAGNLPLNRTTENTLAILGLCGRTDVPVARGADRPLFVPLKTAVQVHGDKGIGNVVLPDPVGKDVEPVHAVDFLYNTIKNHAAQVTLVPVGPLTNIALLLLTHPEIKARIKQIVLMGGGAYRGNESVMAEFNIWVDPEAAKIVFDSGLPIVMAGLDVTMKALAFKDDIKAIHDIGTPVSDFCAEALSFYMGGYERMGEAARGYCAIHDAVTISYLVHPEYFGGKSAHVTVDIDGEQTRGCTTTDFRASVDDADKNTYVLLEVEREKFIGLLKSAMTRPNADGRGAAS